MTQRKKIVASVVMMVVFAATAFCTAFLYPARTIKSVAEPYQAIKDVTEQYCDLAYNTDKYAKHVASLSDAAKKEKYVTLIVDLGIETIADRAGDAAVSEIVGSALYNDSAKAIRTEQDKILRKLRKAGVNYKLEARYDTVLAGVAVEIATEDYATAKATVEKNGGTAIVSEKYYVEKTESTAKAIDVTVNDVNVDEATGIFDSSDVGYDGEGVVVSVLDSGLDYTHSAFTSERAMPNPEKIAMTRNVVGQKIRNTKAYGMDTSLTVADVYVSDKIPYAYDYADFDADVYPLESEHGTHVSSIIAGADDAITGVAPKAQIVFMKVFSDVDDGAKQSNILRAVDDSVTLGVDVINMSLGMNAGFATEEDEKGTEQIYNRVKEYGISLIAAASNAYNSTYGSEANGNLPLTSNPDSGSVGSPSTYASALSVASISGVKTPYLVFEGDPIYYLEASNAAGKQYDFVAMMLKGNESASFQYVTVPGIGDNYSGVDVKGKIALVRRGRTTFEEKVAAAYRAGAIGVIIYNNVSGDIRMSVGNYLYDWGIGCVSMSQDDGERLAAKGTGVIKLSKNYLAGPFMSDFSSWGPAPDLGIKPEITAHGGEIYAAVPGQGYDRLSGTSMASPNQAGVHALVRQYVLDRFDELFPGLDKNDNSGRRAIATLTNQLLMSTTDIAYNEFGNPYSVRKQGSGLANLKNAVTTSSFITVKDGEEELDRTKLELGDDPEKTGVYPMTFTVKNISETAAATFNVDALVYTESVSATLTDKDKTVSSERAYMLSDTTLSVSGTGVSGTRVTVPANGSVELTVTLTLTSSAKAYLDRSFENGMYVEGFVRLTSESGANSGINLNVPYLAFYGDWTQAPMFDLTYFDTNPDEINDAIDDEDKIKPDAYATRPIAGFTSDYIGYMGAYYFMQNPRNVQIPAQEEHISLTNNTNGLNYIYGVWAGLLRPAKTMDITISDTTTGRVIYTQTERNQRKSNSYGSGISMSQVEMKFHVSDYNLKNNTEYTVRLDGHLDYKRDGAETNLKNFYEFTFMTDFEAPKITDVRYYTEYDDSTKETKLFADIDVYDNHYAMALRLGTWNGRTLVEEDYPTPVYGDRSSTNTVTVELTDWIKYTRESYPTPGKYMIFAYDYAMNATIYELSLPTDIESIYVAENDITISRYETKVLEPVLYPTDSFSNYLTYVSKDESIAKVVDGTLVGVNAGETDITVYAQEPSGDEKKDAELVQQKIHVKVLGEGDEGYRRYDRPVVKDFKLTGYHTDFAFYERFSDERHIGQTDDEVKFISRALTMYPGESVTLRWDLKTYFDASVTFSTNDESVVKVDPATGKIVAMGEGKGTVTVEVVGTGGMYRDAVSVEVLDPYDAQGAYLQAYRGMGEDGKGNVEIPAKLNLVQISEFAFSRAESVDKDTEPTEEDPYYTTSGPVGERRPAEYRIKSVIIPEGVEVIGRYAFAKMTSLEIVYLPSTLRQINASAFEGCTALTTVVGLDNVKIISKDAFRNCSRLVNTKRFYTPSTVEFKLSEAIGIGQGAFAGTAIKSASLPKVESAGMGAFENCVNLRSIEFSEKIKIDSSIFAGCENLESVKINAPVISDRAFADCYNLASVTLGKDVAEIGALAFAGTQVSEFKVESGNTVFTVGANKALLLRDGGKTLAAVAPRVTLTSGTLEIPASVDKIGTGAFSCVEELESIVLAAGTEISDYAFYGIASLTSVTAGDGIQGVGNIGDYAFAGTSLSAMPVVGSGVSIGAYAFASIGSVAPVFTSVTVPEGATVGECAFYGNKGLTSLTVGKNAKIGMGAFMDCSALQSVAFTYETAASAPSSITVGDMAFYNCGNIAEVTGADNIVYVGALAFSGDGARYIAQIESIDLSRATSIGMGAFAGNKALEQVTFGEGLTSIGMGAFSDAENLATVNGTVKADVADSAFAYTAIESFEPFENAASIGAYAFAGSGISGSVDLSAVTGSLGAGAFAGTKATSATLREGARVPAYLFAGVPLTEIVNLDKAVYIGEQAFRGAQITEADLGAAVYIGRLAFMSSSIEEVTLGDKLADLGDNPFAYAPIGLFSRDVQSDDRFARPHVSYDFDISDNVKVIGGALYVGLPNGGYELVTYPIEAKGGELTVAEGTVRITDYAAAGNASLRIVNMPYSLEAVGHAAFYGCTSLGVVNFGSIEAPRLEAEYDDDYVIRTDADGTHIFAPGEYEDNSEVTVIAANAAQKIGMTSSPYARLYEPTVLDVLYNNNFVSYVGLTRGLTATYPKNGKGYDAFTIANYFDFTIFTATVADERTRAVIAAIDALPSVITLEHESQVNAARLAYNQLSDPEQAALVTNLETLVRAERSIESLKGNGGNNQPTEPEKPDTDKNGMSGGMIALIVIVVVLGAGLIAVVVIWQLANIRKFIAYVASKFKKGDKADKAATEEAATEQEATEAEPSEAEPTEEAAAADAPREKETKKKKTSKKTKAPSESEEQTSDTSDKASAAEEE